MWIAQGKASVEDRRHGTNTKLTLWRRDVTRYCTRQNALSKTTRSGSARTATTAAGRFWIGMLLHLTLVLSAVASAMAKANQSNLFIDTRQISTPSATVTVDTDNFNYTSAATSSASTAEVKVDLRKCYYDLLSASLYQPYLSQEGFIKFIQLFSNGRVGFVTEWGGNDTRLVTCVSVLCLV